MDAVAVLGVAGVELGEVGGGPGVAGVDDGEDAGAHAGGVVEVVRVVVAGGRRAQAGGEVAEAGAYGDAGAEGEYGGLDLGGAFRGRGDLGGEGVPGEVDGGAHAAGTGEVAEEDAGGGEHGLGDEGRPFGVVGRAEAERLGGLVEGDGDGEGGGGVLFGEGVELAGETARPLGHPAGAVAGRGPAGGVACGEPEEKAFDGAAVRDRGPCGVLGGLSGGPDHGPQCARLVRRRQPGGPPDQHGQRPYPRPGLRRVRRLGPRLHARRRRGRGAVRRGAPFREAGRHRLGLGAAACRLPGRHGAPVRPRVLAGWGAPPGSVVRGALCPGPVARYQARRHGPWPGLRGRVPARAGPRAVLREGRQAVGGYGPPPGLRPQGVPGREARRDRVCPGSVARRQAGWCSPRAPVRAGGRRGSR